MLHIRIFHLIFAILYHENNFIREWQCEMRVICVLFPYINMDRIRLGIMIAILLTTSCKFFKFSDGRSTGSLKIANEYAGEQIIQLQNEIAT